jgi:hypothetical protein
MGHHIGQGRIKRGLKSKLLKAKPKSHENQIYQNGQKQKSLKKSKKK